MSEKIVDVRIKYIKQVKGAANMTLLFDYKSLLRDGRRDTDWMFQVIENEILERMGER